MRRSAEPLPVHRYVPGQSSRHPEDAFDGIRAQADVDPRNAAWVYGLDLAEAGFYWEAHEVLEAVWLKARTGTPERAMIQAIIQLVNAALKQVMGRDKAALRLCGMVDALLDQSGTGAMGLQTPRIRDVITDLRRRIDAGEVTELGRLQ